MNYESRLKRGMMDDEARGCDTQAEAANNILPGGRAVTDVALGPGIHIH